MSLTSSSTCVNRTSIELRHAIDFFKHKFFGKSFSIVWYESVIEILSWLRTSIWSFPALQEKEISSRTTLQSFTCVKMDILGTKRVAVCFCKSVKVRQCFDDLELITLFRPIGYINAQVRKSILNFLAHRIMLLIFTKLPEM